MYTKTINQQGETRYLMDMSERDMKILVAFCGKLRPYDGASMMPYHEWSQIHDELLGGDCNIPSDTRELIEWALNK